jgi:hypothetical protein
MTEDRRAQLLRARGEDARALVMAGTCLPSFQLGMSEPRVPDDQVLFGASSREVAWIQGTTPVVFAEAARINDVGLAPLGVSTQFRSSIVTVSYVPRYYFPRPSADPDADAEALELWLIYRGLRAALVPAILTP